VPRHATVLPGVRRSAEPNACACEIRRQRRRRGSPDNDTTRQRPGTFQSCTMHNLFDYIRTSLHR
jgi:hypothetical protein